MNDKTAVEALVKKGLSIYDICETDPVAEEEGRWFEDIFGDGSKVDVKLRRMTSRVALTARLRIEKPFRRAVGHGELGPETNIKILNAIMAQAVVVDWRGINDREGAPIECCPEVVEDLLGKLPNFRAQLLAFAMTMDNFRIEDRAVLEKN